MRDTSAVDSLLSEWFDWKPTSGRLESIQRGIRKRELLVAEADNKIIGFIHYVIHEDLIDGGPNSFISAFYVSKAHRRAGVGTLLLESAIVYSLYIGGVGVEICMILC